MRVYSLCFLNPTRENICPAQFHRKLHEASYLCSMVLGQPRVKGFAAHRRSLKYRKPKRRLSRPEAWRELSEESELGSEDMATRLARRTRSSSSLFRRWTETSGLRRPSSSSSKSEKPEKKQPLDRLSSIIDAVNERKLPPELRGRRNTVRSETDIINVVEQRIWHSMEEGQFENLPGKGKPLNLSSNPHADPADDTLYRVLSKNGCAPRWVELNKEIRSRASEWRRALKKAWEERDDSKWDQSAEALKLQLKHINNKVMEYNLIVPFGRQMFGLKWERELDRLELKES